MMDTEKNKYYEVSDLKSIVYINEYGENCIEEWKTIPNYMEYKVSDLGRVKSIDRITFDFNKIKYNRIGKIIKNTRQKQHLQVNTKVFFGIKQPIDGKLS